MSNVTLLQQIRCECRDRCDRTADVSPDAVRQARRKERYLIVDGCTSHERNVMRCTRRYDGVAEYSWKRR